VAVELKLSWRHVAVGIIDDSTDWRRTVRAMVQSFGVTDVVEAFDGADFFKKAEEVGHGLDLLLVDDEMQPMDGLTMMQALRSKKTSLSRRATSILMPGHGHEEIVLKALDVGYHSILPKPFSASALEQHAQRVLMRPSTWKEEKGLLRPLPIEPG
jgi:PleD family two-component response regulator